MIMMMAREQWQRAIISIGVVEKCVPALRGQSERVRGRYRKRDRAGISSKPPAPITSIIAWDG